MMEPVTRARVGGGAAIVVGVGLAVMGEWSAALGVFTAGAAILMLVTERGVPDELPDASAGGPQSGLGLLARDLQLHGRGIILTRLAHAEGSRLLVPVKDPRPEDLGRLDAAATLQREERGAIGVLVPPPGAALEALWRDGHGLPTGAGPEEALVHIRGAFARFGIDRDVTLARSGTTIRLAYTPTLYQRACASAAGELAPWHVQGGCPACSLAAILLAHAHGGTVRMRDAGVSEDTAWLEVEVFPLTQEASTEVAESSAA